MKNTLIAVLATAALAPTLAMAKADCPIHPKAEWLKESEARAKLEAQGYKIRKFKVDGQCYEIYGFNKEGKKDTRGAYGLMAPKSALNDWWWGIYQKAYNVYPVQAPYRMAQALMGVGEHTHLHISFDVDFLDPDIAPGVGTPVRGGPSYREAQLCMEMLADTGCIGSLDVVELNPARDIQNRTAELVVDLLESLFGKSTLMRSRS